MVGRSSAGGSTLSRVIVRAALALIAAEIRLFREIVDVIRQERARRAEGDVGCLTNDQIDRLRDTGGSCRAR